MVFFYFERGVKLKIKSALGSQNRTAERLRKYFDDLFLISETFLGNVLNWNVTVFARVQTPERRFLNSKCKIGSNNKLEFFFICIFFSLFQEFKSNKCHLGSPATLLGPSTDETGAAAFCLLKLDRWPSTISSSFSLMDVSNISCAERLVSARAPPPR